jgi:hypothetical protein
LPEPEEPPDYAIPLHELTGKHGYALARSEDDDTPPEPGAPVAYVADPVKEQPNTMTVEGAIVGIGNLAAAAARDEDPTSALVLKIVLAFFLLPIVVIVVGRLTEWF